MAVEILATELIWLYTQAKRIRDSKRIPQKALSPSPTKPHSTGALSLPVGLELG